MKIILESRYRGIYINFPYWYEKPVRKLFLPLTTISPGEKGAREIEKNYKHDLAGWLAGEYFDNKWPSIDSLDIEYSVLLWHEASLQKRFADKSRKKDKQYDDVKQNLSKRNVYANQCPHCYNDAAVSDDWVNLNGGLAFRCLVCSGDFVRWVHEFTLEQKYALLSGMEFDYEQNGTDAKRSHPVLLKDFKENIALIYLF